MHHLLRLASASSRTGAITVEIAARRAFFTGLVIITLLAAANVIVQLLRHVWGFQRLFGFIALFDFDAEGNLPTLFSVFLLASCTALLAAIGAFERGRDQRASRYWFGLGGVTAYLMIDEGAQIHEPIGAAIHAFFNPGGYLYFAWVIPGMAAFAVLFVVFSRFVFGLERPLRRRIGFAVLLYAGGGLGMELIAANHVANNELDLTFAIMATVEETLEAVGALWLLRALLLHAAGIGVRIEAVFRDHARGAPAASQ